MAAKDAKFALEELKENTARILRNSKNTASIKAETYEAVQNATTVTDLVKAISAALMLYGDGISGANRSELGIIRSFIKLQYPEEFPGKAR
jgi:hypothetical protein